MNHPCLCNICLSARDAELKRALSTQLEEIEGAVAGMEEEDNYSTMYADYTPEKAVDNSKAILNYNHALRDVLAKLADKKKYL